MEESGLAHLHPTPRSLPRHPPPDALRENRISQDVRQGLRHRPKEDCVR